MKRTTTKRSGKAKSKTRAKPSKAARALHAFAQHKRDEPAVELPDFNECTPNQKRFLTAYSLCGNISRAARIAELTRRVHYQWLEADSKYKAAFEDAHSIACDHLIEEARRRGHEGLRRPVLFQGAPVFVWVDPQGNIVRPKTPGASEVALIEHEYSDTLLIFLLKGLLPEVFRDNVAMRTEHAGHVKHEHEHTIAELTDEQRLTKVRDLLDRVRRRTGIAGPDDAGGTDGTGPAVGSTP